MPLLKLEIHFFPLFAYMLWQIELKFCIWLCFTVLQIKFKCFNLLQISALFSSMHWNIELKFCIWLCLTVQQIKFECSQFLWELCPFWNLEYWKYSFLHFSLTCFDIISWICTWLCLMYYRSRSSVISQCPSGSPCVNPFSVLSS